MGMMLDNAPPSVSVMRQADGRGLARGEGAAAGRGARCGRADVAWLFALSLHSQSRLVFGSRY